MSEVQTSKPDIVGQTIRAIRPLSESEITREGWDIWNNTDTCMVIELESGMIIYPSRDEEGNGPGCLFGIDPDGVAIYVVP